MNTGARVLVVDQRVRSEGLLYRTGRAYHAGMLKAMLLGVEDGQGRKA